jgi:outer membrane protein assembly factor BamA
MYAPDSTELFRFKLLPVINYSPETRLGFGGGLILNWDYKNASPGTNSSLLQSFFLYTQNKQIEWTNKFEIYTNENKFFFSGAVAYIKFPQYYFGVGDEIPFDNRENFSFQQVYLDLKNRLKVKSGFYLGLDYYFNKNYDVVWLPDSKFENDSALYGTQGYLISGIGPELVYDTRDFPFNPSKGSFISASVLFFFEGIGSEFSYTYYALDMRHFFLVNKKKRWVLGLNLYGLFSPGETPFNRLPGLGGAQIMRGYYSGRFRDQNYIAAQIEWRMPVWKMIGIAAWLGTGEVSASFDQFSLSGLKPNAGVGLRVRFDKRSKLNIRADEGFGTNSSGFYLKINEAF